MTPRMLKEIGIQMILGNTYHLYLRPGPELIKEAGGLHRFIGWEGPILTDSGGYQVFSLSDLRKISDEGVTFKSHIDGSSHLFTPEKVVEIQLALGSDIMMPLDECPPYPCERKLAEEAVRRTTAWAKRSLAAYRSSPVAYREQGFAIGDERYAKSDTRGVLFGIVQGSTYPELRRRSAEETVALDFPGYAIGGLSVGEPMEMLHEVLGYTVPFLPQDKPRYLLGLGSADDIVEAVKAGADFFDCTMPTRLGRHGSFFTREGTLHIRNAKYERDFTPLEEGCACYACQNFTRAYLRHLLLAKEILGVMLMTFHNLWYLARMLDEVRRDIEEDRF